MPKDPAELVGQYRGRLLIMGSAPSFWDDLERYEKSFPEHDKMAINHVGVLYFGSFQHWASCHMDSPIFHPQNTRAAVMNEQHEEILLHGKRNAKSEAYGWNIKDCGTSAMFATEVGLRLGYDKITLAGVPLDNSGYFYGPPSHWNDFANNKNRGLWAMAAKSWEWKERVTSMSAYTREILGEPQ